MNDNAAQTEFDHRWVVPLDHTETPWGEAPHISVELDAWLRDPAKIKGHWYTVPGEAENDAGDPVLTVYFEHPSDMMHAMMRWGMADHV